MKKMTPKFELTDQVALVTGGSSGLGLAIAEAFRGRGARVVIVSRDQQRILAATSRLQSKEPADDDGHQVAGLTMDVTDDDSVRQTIEEVLQRFGGIDILVNSAGFTNRKPTFDRSADEFNQFYETHVAGSFRCASEVGRAMRKKGKGSIINLASVASSVDLIEVAPYCAAKHAVIGLTQSLANEWAKYGIRVNALVCGFVPTELNRSLIMRTDRGRRVLERTPMGRFGRPEEVAAAAVFLASDAASFITGHGLVVDGGFLCCGIGDQVAEWPKSDL